MIHDSSQMPRCLPDDESHTVHDNARPSERARMDTRARHFFQASVTPDSTDGYTWAGKVLLI